MSDLAKRSDGGLLKVEQARQLLAECRRVDDAKLIRDKAQAIAAYLRQQNASAEAQNDAAEIKLRAERRPRSREARRSKRTACQFACWYHAQTIRALARCRAGSGGEI